MIMIKKAIAALLALMLICALSACDIVSPFTGHDGSAVEVDSSSIDVNDAIGGAASAEVENKVMLSLNKLHFDQNETIEVTLDFGSIDQDRAVIAIVSSNTGHGTALIYEDTDSCEEYRFLSDFSELPFYMSAPLDKDGLFDVRVYSDYEDGEELASITIAVGSATLPETGVSASDGSSQSSGEGGALKQSGDCTKRQMENTIVSYFAPICSLASLTLCDGVSIEYSMADIPWQTVDIFTINDPAIGYDELAASMSAQLTAAGLSERLTGNGGYEWSVAVGDKSMRIELRPYDPDYNELIIYATPEAE